MTTPVIKTAADLIKIELRRVTTVYSGKAIPIDIYVTSGNDDAEEAKKLLEDGLEAARILDHLKKHYDNISA